jgi:hypothetical protein
MAMSLVGGDAEEAAQMCATVVQLSSILCYIPEMYGVLRYSARIFPDRMDLLALSFFGLGKLRVAISESI